MKMTLEENGNQENKEKSSFQTKQESGIYTFFPITFVLLLES